jgi:hypothetical protein
MNQFEKTKKSIDLMFAAAVLINTAAAHFKTDNNLYKHKTKRLINELYNESVRLLKEKNLIREALSSEENAKQHSLKYNIEVDPESAVENFEDNNDLLVKLIAIYIKAADYSKVIDTMIIANQLLENKKVYTEVELLNKLKTAVNDHCNYKINEENLKKYL